MCVRMKREHKQHRKTNIIDWIFYIQREHDNIVGEKKIQIKELVVPS